MDEDDDKEPIWFEADAETVEEMARHAQLRGESVGEFIGGACRRYDQD